MSSSLDSVIVDVGRLGPILDGDQPAQFVPGWTPSFVYRGFAPLLVLCFRHEDGALASWFLDEGLNRRGSGVGELAPDLAIALAESCAVLFDGLWHKIMQSPVPQPLNAREAGFFRLPENTRIELLDHYLRQFDTGTRFRSIDHVDPERPGSQLLDVGSRRLAMRRQHLHTLFNPGGLQEQNHALVEHGRMSFPSPVDGRPMIVRHALVLHGTLHAYRAVEEATGTVMFLVAGEIFFRLAGLFVPEGRCCLALDPGAIQGQMPDMFREFFNRIAQHGDLLARYFANDRTVPLHAWRGVTAMHIGHVLWNDISGIGELIRRARPAQLPRFAVFDAQLQPEMYGPLDTIFPELRGKVERSPRGFQESIPSFYQNGQCVFRTSAMTVSADVRERILATVRPLDDGSPAARCVRAHADGIPVVMFGIRVENRTAVNLEALCLALVDQVAASLGRAVLVVDGHNSRIGEKNSFIWSHGEHDASRRPIDVEREMVAAMRARARNTGVELLDTIGLPITESLAAGREAQVLVAIWGAGLAKYRWVCNLPGLVITNHWNLKQLNDLRIYDHPHNMEAPTELRFLDPAIVEDLPDAEPVVRLGAGYIPSVCNFRIDERAAMREVAAVLDAFVPVPA